MKVGKKIRAIRQAKGLKIADIEAKAGLSDGNLSRIERGVQWLSEEKIFSLAAALDVDAGDFFSSALSEFNQDGKKISRTPGTPERAHVPLFSRALNLSIETAAELRLLSVYRLANEEERRLIDIEVDIIQRQIGVRSGFDNLK